MRASHERFDGGGYPDGLHGTEIPLGARVIFVCDAFDAMTSERTYSGAIAAGAALAELRACAGTQFDPTVVAAFVETLEEAGLDCDPRAPRARAGQPPARSAAQLTLTIVSRLSPRGSTTAACSPLRRPARARATGDSAERRPSAGAASWELTIFQVRCDAVLIADDDGRAEADDAGAGPLALLDDDRSGDLFAQPRDLGLKVRLVVLGVVVLAVLLQVAPLARGFDPLGDLAAALLLERVELGLQLGQAGRGHQVGGLVHRFD